MADNTQTRNTEEMVAVRNVTLRIPQTNQTLIENQDMSIKKGDRLIITGESGSGKSTLIRAIRDLWETGSGEIVLPEGANILVASQKAYAPNTSLAGVMCAPKLEGSFSNEDIARALNAVGRGRLIQYLPGQTTKAIANLLMRNKVTDLDQARDFATKLIRENVDNLQTVSKDDADYLHAALGSSDRAKTDALVQHIEQEYAQNLRRRLMGWAVPGLVASYQGTVPATDTWQAKFIQWRLGHGLDKNLNKALTKMWTPKRGKHADWLGGTRPTKNQVAYLAEGLRTDVAAEMAKTTTANYGLNRLSFVFGTAAKLVRFPGVVIRGVAAPFNWAAEQNMLLKPLKLVGGALWLTSKPFDVGANIMIDGTNWMKRTAPFGTMAGRGVSNVFNAAAFALRLPRMNALARKTAKGIATQVNAELAREVFNGRVLSNRLSGGEQQRIIFARALLHKPDILILDEVTAALDRPAAIKLYDDLVKALPDTTIISIAHNEHVIQHHTQHAHLQDRKLTVKPVAKPS